MLNSPELICDSIRIDVETHYISEQSVPEEERFVFSYTINIKNKGQRSAKLMSRNWLITDANGDTSEVEGEGVVGQQPEIAPASSFTYTSGCILKTPIGTMQGFYHMQDEQNKSFDVEIPVFRLAIPNILN